QAEDGIRVFHVTGVQTCALPIYVESGGKPRSQTISNTTRPKAASQKAPRRSHRGPLDAETPCMWMTREEGRALDLGPKPPVPVTAPPPAPRTVDPGRPYAPDPAYPPYPP